MTVQLNKPGPEPALPAALPARARFVATGRVRGGGRLPPPGEVIDLSTLSDLDTDPQPQPKKRQPAPEQQPETQDTEAAPEEAEHQPRPAEDRLRKEPDDQDDQDQEEKKEKKKEEAEKEKEAYAALGRAANALADMAGQGTRHVVATIKTGHASPSLQQRRRALTYNATAAAAGYWGIPLVLGPDISLPAHVTDLMNRVTEEASLSGAAVIGAILVTGIWALVDRPVTKHITNPARAWTAVRWVCRIPLASAVLGVLLWDPAWQALAL